MKIAADRYLDALVAEKVMGWHDMEPPRRAAGGFGSPWRGKPAGMKRFADRAEFPKYSTDISAAWEVAEELGLSVLKVAEGWQARSVVSIRDETSSNGDTAPLAICRCALTVSLICSEKAQSGAQSYENPPNPRENAQQPKSYEAPR